jgi:hypothetical protein
MNDKTKCILWLRIDKPSHNCGAYGHVILGTDITVEGSTYQRDEHRGLYLRDFIIQDQIGESSTPADPDYAWTYGFKSWIVDSYDHGRMAKTFKAIERSMTKNDGKFGRAKTYGAWVARIANAIGAESVNIPYVNASQDRRDPFPLGPAVNMIDNWVLELGKQVRKFAGKQIESDNQAAA